MHIYRLAGQVFDDLIHLTPDDMELITQQNQTGRLTLKRVLAIARMRAPTTGHLAHFDEDAPYIAYVRFESTGDNSINRAFKPVEFYKLLME